MKLLIRWLIFCGALAGSGPALAQSVASSWVDQERARSRLLAAEAEGGLVAFFEIEMPAGWKTYWRNPGDAGGLPPTLDFSASDNASGAMMLFPAPKRLSDVAGETIGYKDRVAFPVRLQVADPLKPVVLRVAANFGVCKEICVPLQATHELTVPPGSVGPAEGMLRDALERVPRAAAAARAGDPQLMQIKAVSAGDAARIAITVAFAGDGQDGDLFVEAPEGLYVPMPKRAEVRKDGSVVFEATMGSAAELKQLVGQPLKVTMVGGTGQSEAVAKLE
jgi:DsbC/DsbD-like thiol-disulfide interchange protein